jgi:Rha family phage regulatory protein
MITNLPTNSELLQGDLFAIGHQHKKVITNSLQLAYHFDKRPSEVNRRIASLIKKGLCRIAPSYYLNQQGKQQNYYELNRDQFLLVVMGFTGDKADQFKAEFIQLFNSQEAELLQWRKQRLLTSESTKRANDQVYLLQADLAKEIPRSKRCTMIFIHFQDAINIAVTGSAKTKRSDMTSHQLIQISQLEQFVNDEIKRLRLDGVPPQQIRDDVLTMIITAKKKPRPAAKPKGAYLMQFNNTYHQHNWQLLLQQAQALAARLPDMGLNPDKLALLPLDDC